MENLGSHDTENGRAWLGESEPILDQQSTVILIRICYDTLTQDFCAECDDFGGLLNWGATANMAMQKLVADWNRHRRHLVQEAAIHKAAITAA